MKTKPKPVKHAVVQSQPVRKRPNATQLALATLAESIRCVQADAGRDHELHEQQIRLLDDKAAMVDTVIHSIDTNIAQCQNVVLAVKEAIGLQTQDFSTVLKQADEEHQIRFADLDERVTRIGETVRSLDETHVHRDEAMHTRIQLLEERVPGLQEEIQSLHTSIAGIAQAQRNINVRLITVMRMSMMIIGVLVAATVVMGLIYFKG